MLVKAVGSRAEVEAAEKLNLEEAVAVVLVVAVLAMLLVLLDMEKDPPMMEEEKGDHTCSWCARHPPRFLEFDQSYMVQHQGALVRREPVTYDHGV